MSNDRIDIQRIWLTDDVPMSAMDQLDIGAGRRRHGQLFSHAVFRMCLPAGQVLRQLLRVFRYASVDVFCVDRQGTQRSHVCPGDMYLVDFENRPDIAY